MMGMIPDYKMEMEGGLRLAVRPPVGCSAVAFAV